MDIALRKPNNDGKSILKKSTTIRTILHKTEICTYGIKVDRAILRLAICPTTQLKRRTKTTDDYKRNRVTVGEPAKHPP